MLGFAKRYVVIQGRAVPGIQISESQDELVTLPSGKSIRATFADVLTLRGTNPDNGPVTEYLTVTRENLRFTVLRFDNVIGLDVDADGTMLTMADLETRRLADIIARQSQNLAKAATASVDLDDIDIEELPVENA